MTLRPRDTEVTGHSGSAASLSWVVSARPRFPNYTRSLFQTSSAFPVISLGFTILGKGFIGWGFFVFFWGGVFVFVFLGFFFCFLLFLFVCCFFVVVGLDFFFFFFFCVCDRFINPTTEVVTFRLCGWCMLGVFLLLAFTRLGHECQDLLNPCD